MARGGRKSFVRDTGGATIIEFALLAPIFFGLLAAILETALMFLTAQVLESGVQDASRAIRVGQAFRENWVVADYKEAVCGRLFGLFGDCSDMHVNVTQLDNFTVPASSAPVDRNCTSQCPWTEDDAWTNGASSAVMLVQVHYRLPTILQFGPFANTVLGDGRRLLSAATVFKNEPF